MLPKFVQDEIQNVTKQLIEKYHPQKIILFGSAAWATEEFNKDSDLDFFIVKDDVPDKGHERGYQLHMMINYDVACDFIVAKEDEIKKRLSMEDPFVEKIINSGHILYDK